MSSNVAMCTGAAMACDSGEAEEEAADDGARSSSCGGACRRADTARARDVTRAARHSAAQARDASMRRRGEE